MTSSKLFDEKMEEEGKTSPPASGLIQSEETCASCGGPMRLRNARPFPVALQVAFGLSFITFLWAQGTGKLSTEILWGWSAIQIILGILLARARYASAKKVFICLRCGAPLR